MTEFAHGLVIGKFYPPHRGHHLLISTAARRCARVTVVACAADVESIPLADRVAWLRAEHEPNVRVVGAVDNHEVDYGDPHAWELHCAVFRSALAGAEVDAVFSSEEYGGELARRFGAVNVQVDLARARVPVSGTAIRADPARYWEFLAPSVRAGLAKRVVVLGAESTGTTTLSRALAAHYRRRYPETQWVPEFGRELTERKLAALGPQATVDQVVWEREDFALVVERQNELEEYHAALGGPYLFCDTDSFATRLWEERYLGSTSVFAESDRRADLYLLTDHEGVPFEDDGLRDGEHLRAWMTGRFAELLDGRHWLRVTGTPEQRLEQAIAACEELGWWFADPLKPR